MGGRLEPGSGRVVWILCVDGRSRYLYIVLIIFTITMRIPAHLMCTQYSIMLHHIDICFLTCICLWHISQIQTCLCVVVGPGLVATSPAFMRSQPSSGSAWPACPKNGNRAPIAVAQGLADRCHSSNACRLCRLEQ